MKLTESKKFFRRTKTKPHIVKAIELCQMPDIADLTKVKLVSNYIINQLVGAGTNTKREVELYRVNFVRIVDKAIFEYLSARELVIENLAEPLRPYNDLLKGRQIYTHSIINHLENCINSVNRAINLLDKIKATPEGPDVDKLKRRFIESHSEDINKLRNSIEHIEGDISSDAIKAGTPAAIMISEDTRIIQISDHEISVHDLAAVLRNLHQVGLRINEFKGVPERS